MHKLIKNSAGFSALEVALVVIVMGLLGGSGYYVYQNQSNTKEAAPTTPSDTSQTPTTSAEFTSIIDQATQAVTQQHANLTAERPGANSPTYFSPFLSYASPGYDFLPTIKQMDTAVQFYDKGGYPYEMNAKEVPADTAAIINKGLLSAGAVRVKAPLDIKQFGADGPLSGYYAFTNGVCMLTQSKEKVTSITLTCGTLDEFAAAGAAAKPFVAQLATETKTDVSNLVVEQPNIKKNTLGTYERADMHVNSRQTDATGAGTDAQYIFYRKIGATDWTFYMGTQEGIGCPDAKTQPVAHEALLGGCSNDDL